MKQWKRWLCLLVAMLMLCAATACGDDTTSDTESQEEASSEAVSSEEEDTVDGTRSWSCSYLENLVVEKGIPHTTEDEYGMYGIAFQSNAYYNLYYVGGTSSDDSYVALEFIGSEFTYLISFMNYVYHDETFDMDNDYNGTKAVFCMGGQNDIATLTADDIVADITSVEYGEEVLDIIHTLYGDDFEEDIISVIKNNDELDETSDDEAETGDLEGFQNGTLGAKYYRITVEDGEKVICYYEVIPKVEYE